MPSEAEDSSPSTKIWLLAGGGAVAVVIAGLAALGVSPKDLFSPAIELEAFQERIVERVDRLELSLAGRRVEDEQLRLNTQRAMANRVSEQLAHLDSQIDTVRTVSIDLERRLDVVEASAAAIVELKTKWQHTNILLKDHTHADDSPANFRGSFLGSWDAWSAVQQARIKD